MRYLNYHNFFKKLSLILVVFLINSCHSFLFNPHGKIAIEEFSLILISFFMMLIVVIPVIFMTIYFSYKYRINNKSEIYKPNWSESKKIEITIWVIPILIISFLAILAWNYSHKLEPKKSIESIYNPIKIDVVALDWKWLFIYPDYNIATINKIVFPVNRPIQFRITSDSVMNSFFIPSLGSQVYAMPGMITKLNLISNDVGKYKGISSNYSGEGFSDMKFTVISVPNNTIFLNWINKIQHLSKIFSNQKISNKRCFIEYFSAIKKNFFNHVVHQYLKKITIIENNK